MRWRRDQTNVVKGRISTSAFISSAALLGVPIAIWGGSFWSWYFDLANQRLCETGPLGLTASVWFYFPVFVLVSLIFLGVAVGQWRSYRVAKSLGEYPDPRRIPLFDVERVGSADIAKFRKRSLSMALLSAAASIVLSIMWSDWVTTYVAKRPSEFPACQKRQAGT
jgi:uncharacterized membrane protein